MVEHIYLAAKTMVEYISCDKKYGGARFLPAKTSFINDQEAGLSLITNPVCMLPTSEILFDMGKFNGLLIMYKKGIL